MEFKLVYGNHGKDPVHVLETLLLVKYSLEALGHKADLVHNMVPGKTNVLVECFTYDFLEVYKEFSKTPETQFILIATEIITGSTFNKFEEVDQDSESHYTNRSYWDKRLRTFSVAAQYAKAIWHLCESEVPVFSSHFNKTNVFYLPHGYTPELSKVRHKKESHKDIDVIFTGTLTSYRRTILQQFKKMGISAEISTPLSPAIREDLVARSKIAVNIKPTKNWLYPSNSRYHYHLQNRSLIISETCPKSCDLTEFVISSPFTEIVETCKKWIDNSNRQAEAEVRLEQFMKKMPMTELMESLLDASFNT